MRQSNVHREVELVRYGDSGDCDGCNAQQLRAKAKLDSEGCRARIRQAMMNDDVSGMKLAVGYRVSFFVRGLAANGLTRVF